jgi:integrase
MPKLTTKKIERLLKAGNKCRVLDGAGLHLQVRSNTNASWILRYVSPVTGKTRELGLGSVSSVGLAEARQKAAEARVMVGRGQDPIATKPSSEIAPGAQSSSITFGEAAATFWEAQQARWRNKRVREGWLGFMRRHTAKIWSAPIDQVDQVLMVKVLQPLWGLKHDTARRTLHRCGQVIDYSRVMGWRKGANPARFRGELEYALPNRPANVNVRHYSAVPLDQLPALMGRLATVPSSASLAARFCILTASRPGEVFGATWAEIEGNLWRIPPKRYKTLREHVVPLSKAAMDVLASCPRFESNPYVFVSPRLNDRALSNMAVIALWKRMGIAATLHGTARSSFSDWAHDETDTAHEIIEECLGHAGSAVSRAYRRGQAIEKRRALLEAWGRRLTAPGMAVHRAQLAALSLPLLTVRQDALDGKGRNRAPLALDDVVEAGVAPGANPGS